MISGNFSSDGSTGEFATEGFTLCLGNETNANFGGGTITILVRQNETLDWTVDSTYKATGVIISNEFKGMLFARIRLSGSTSPNLDYSFKN